MYGKTITTSVAVAPGNPEVSLTAIYVGANSAAMADVVGIPTGATDVKVVIVKPGSNIPWEYDCRKVGTAWRVTFTGESFDVLGESFYEIHFKMPTYYFSGRGRLSVVQANMQGIVPQMDPDDPEAGRYVVLAVNGKKPDGSGNVVIDISAEVAGKADKVANATAGNLASLTAGGNLADSGKKAADFASASDLAYLREEVFQNGYSLIKKLREYLWLVEYRDVDYDFAAKFLKDHYAEAPLGNCSAIRNARCFGRTWDWYYDDCANFIVRTEAHNGKHRTIGMAGGISALTDAIVASRAKSEWFKVLPCVVTDGVNDASVVACINVVPKKATSGWTGTEVCFLSAVRTALDNFDNAAAAAAHLAAKVWVPSSYPFDVHYMISDRTSTWLVEDGVAKQISGRPYMTNFRVAEDSVVDNEVDFNMVNARDPYGMGVERMNVILSNYATCATVAGMRTLLGKLKYTLAYAPEQEPFWYTEYTGNDVYGDLTVIKAVADPGAFMGKVTHWLAVFNERSRVKTDPGYGTWQTVSSVVYDIFSQELFVVVQEEDPKFVVEARLDGTATTTLDGLMSAADKEKLDKGGSVEGKADKVKNATAGDLAGLDASGNLTDSGVSKTHAMSRVGGYLQDTENPDSKVLVLTVGTVPND